MRLISSLVQIFVSPEYETHKWLSSNFRKGLFIRPFLIQIGDLYTMDVGHFYFLKSSYFKDFPDNKLIQNKESLDGLPHDRPCFYSFLDEKSGVNWMIPFSSKIDKYKDLYREKMLKYNKCETLVFGYVLGYEKAFLIQNMFPVIDKYIHNEYIDDYSKTPITVDGRFQSFLIQKAKNVLFLTRQGNKYLVFPDILKIEKELISMLSKGIK